MSFKMCSRKQRPQSQLGILCTPTHDVQGPDPSDLSAGCAEQTQGNQETSPPGDQPQHSPSSSGFHVYGNEEAIITSARVTDVALGLRRVPAGFYIMVHHSGLQWTTENKCSSVNDDVVKWNGPIPVPSELSATVCIEVYASFEFQPMLGAGEQLRRLTVTVEELLDHSAKDAAFTLFPKDGDVVCSCSSISVTVEWQKSDVNASPTVGALGPHCSRTQSQGELEDATEHGHNALSLYRKYGRRQDLEHSVEEFEHALSICPLDHPCRAAAQSNLAMAKFIHCQIEDTDACFEAPLDLYSDALAARPVGHLDRPSTLVHLAAVKFARFKKRMDGAEGTQAQALLHEAVELSSVESHEMRAATFMLLVHSKYRVHPVGVGGQLLAEDASSRLTEEDPLILSLWLLERFELSGDLVDLQRAITILEELVKSTSVWDERHCIVLTNLGTALLYRFNYLGRLSDLEDAISRHRDAVDLTPYGHPHRPSYLNNLGSSFRARFERLGELVNLEGAISMHRDALDLTPHGHPDQSSRLNNLGNTMLTRFERLGELSDLEDAISNIRSAVDLISDGHPDKPGRLNNLGNVFLTRFERLGELIDLKDAISILRNAVDLTPHDHPDKPRRLNSLGNSLLTRFRCLGGLDDLEDAISCYRRTVDLTPRSHPDKSARLHNLGNSFETRFKRLGELSDLDNAILVLRDAVDLIPHGHPHRPYSLDSLGNSLLTRFEHLGELHDLQDATSMLENAVEVTPDGHPDKPPRLNNLGNVFVVRYNHLAEVGDLEHAVSTLTNAVDLTPHDHPDKPACLSNLGMSLRARFECLRDPSDLEDAISKHKTAVSLTPDGHAERPRRLTNLGNTLLARFGCIGGSTDLEDAISTLTDAVGLLPCDHPDKPTCLNNLGKSFWARFKHLGEPSDLNHAILRHKDALDLTPNGHPDKPARLNNLGNSLRARFELLGELSDCQDAVSVLRDAVYLIPHGHPHKSIILNSLGNCLLSRFQHLGEANDLEQAISVYSYAASDSIGPVSTRFQSSQNWIAAAQRIRHHSLLYAYSSAITLLPQLAWIGLPLMNRYSELTQGADVVREAAATALDSGLLETAVEWLEQGRSIVWGELFQLRSSYEELSSAHPDHARRLQELSSALEYAGTTREKTLFTLSEQIPGATQCATESLQQVGNRHRTLAIERDRLLQEIRCFPGFERFLLQQEFSKLRASAHAGPIVILNAAERRCDALIVLANVDHVIHVPLPNFTLQQSTYLQSTLKGFIRHARVAHCDEREGKSVPWDGISWESILAPLWKCVVRPVLDALAFSTPGDLSRIFWCPTGPFTFLPIHAAGLYDADYSQSGHKVFDFVVSSYIPTLSILAPSHGPGAAPSGNVRLLAVRQPLSDGLSPLPGVAIEVEHIKEVIKNAPSTRATVLESLVGTVEEVLGLMKEADWVHFACHGIQDTTSPIDSGLCLADRQRLRLRDVVALSRPRGGLAFLSACQTATGDERLSEEAVHIAAGMLFAGYGGVVGTMWAISDRLAPDVAREVYEWLVRSDARPDYREAARALHEAVWRLREDNASFVEWVPFIHVGL